MWYIHFFERTFKCYIFIILLIIYLLIFYSYYCKLKIPYRCISKIYREWSSSHNIIRPFKHNRNLNKRWDTCDHPFYEKVLNGEMIPEISSLFENYSVNKLESMKKKSCSRWISQKVSSCVIINLITNENIILNFLLSHNE